MRVRKGRRKRGSFKIPKVNCIISGYVCLCLVLECRARVGAAILFLKWLNDYARGLKSFCS